MRFFRTGAAVLGIAMLLSAVEGCGGAASSDNGSTPSSDVTQLDGEFVKLSEQPTLFFFGDEDWAISKYDAGFLSGMLGDNAVGYFAYCFEVFFADKDPKFFNYAQNNGTLATTAASIASHCKENAKQPDLVFIQLGDNDLDAADMTPEKYTADLKAAIAKATAGGARAVVVGPVTAKEVGDPIREKLPDYISAAKAACDGNPYVKHIDFQATADATTTEYIRLSKKTHEDMTVLGDEVQVKMSSAMVRELDLVKVSGRKINTAAFEGGKTVIIEGDSVSDCYRSNHMMGDRMYEEMDLGYSYVMGVKAYLDAVYGNVIVMNGAVAGSTTGSMMLRYEMNVTDWEPDYLISMIGINDCAAGYITTGEYPDIPKMLEDVRTNMTSFFEQSKDIDRVLFISPYYAIEEDNAVLNDLVIPTADLMLDLAKNYENVTTMKTQDMIWSAVGKYGLGAISPDRVHLAAKAYRIFLANVMNTLGW